MQVVTLNLSQLAVDKDFNVRESKNYGDIDSLATQIGKDGQLNPIQVGPADADGKFPVIAGFRRVAAIRKLSRGGQDIPVFAVVIDKEESERAWLNLTENLAREDLTSYERAKGLARMVESFGWKPAQIASRFGVSEDGTKVKGMSPSNISNLVTAFGKLSDKCLEAWSKGQVTTEGAFALKGYQTHEEQDELLPYVKGKSGAALVQAIEDFENGGEVAGGSSDSDEDKPRKRSKPGPVTIRKAIAWAKENNLDEVVIALKWVIGQGGKKLKISDDVMFDPKAKDEDEDGGEE